MKPLDLDPSLAFTALLELDPDFRGRTIEENSARRHALLDAWYAQDEIRSIWDFAKQWLKLDPAADEIAGAVRDWAGGDAARIRTAARIIAGTKYLGDLGDTEGGEKHERHARITGRPQGQHG